MNNAPRLSQLEGVFSQVISVALTLVGVTALVVILLGGFQYLSASGNKEAAGKARLTLTFGLVGLILAISAWMILNISGTFLGVNFGSFSICATSPC